MRNSIYRITLDIHNEAPQVQIAAKRGDSLRQVQATLTERGKPYFPEAGVRAVTVIKTPAGTTLMGECEIRSDGTVCYDFVPETTKDEGLYECELQVLGEGLETLFTPRFTILVAENVFEDGAKIAVREFADEMADMQTAVEALEAAQEEDGRVVTELRKALEELAENAPDLCVVTAQYNFESDYVITVDKEPEEWVLDGSRRFVLRLTDGNRTLELPMLVGGKSVYDRWMLAGIRPTGQISGMPYTIGGDTAQQPDYIYAPMGIDNSAHSSANCMYVKALDGGKYFWISKPHVTASLSGIAHDVFAPPSALAGYNASSTYNTGDIVIYSSKVYRCTADSVTGAWDATKWAEQATVYTYFPADYAFLPLTSATVASAYPNLHSLPAHTVTYINTSWFTSGATGLASGWYYVCTTGVKSSGYAMRLALAPVSRRLYVSEWVANAQETGGGHWGGWTSLTDSTLALEGAAADAKAVGDLLFGGSTHTYRTPHTMIELSSAGVAALTKLDEMPAWSAAVIYGSRFLELQTAFPDADEIRSDAAYYLEKRGYGATGRLNQYTLYRATKETVWTGYTSNSDTAETQTIRWSKLIRPTDALAWWDGFSNLTPPESGRLDPERYLDEMPRFSMTSITGEQFLYLQPDFPDAGEIDARTTYYLERRGMRTNEKVNFYTLYRSPRTTVWAGYTSITDTETHQTVYWNKIISPGGSAADNTTPGYVSLGASTVWGAVKTLDTTAASRSAYRFPVYVANALHMVLHDLSVGNVGFLSRGDDGTRPNFMDAIYAPTNAAAFQSAGLISIVFGYGNDGASYAQLPVGSYDDYYPYDAAGYHPAGLSGVSTMRSKGATLFGCLNWCIKYIGEHFPKAQLVLVFAAPSQNRDRTVAMTPQTEGVGTAPFKLTFADPYGDDATTTEELGCRAIGRELPKLQKALSIPIIDTYNDVGNAFSVYQTNARGADHKYAVFSTTGDSGASYDEWVLDRHPNDDGYKLYARYIAGLIVRQFMH